MTNVGICARTGEDAMTGRNRSFRIGRPNTSAPLVANSGSKNVCRGQNRRFGHPGDHRAVIAIGNQFPVTR